MAEVSMTADRSVLVRKALNYEYVLVGWNVLEACIAVAAGVMAGSVALVGFGLDSIIEVTSAGTLIWRLKKYGSKDAGVESRAEKRALRIVGVTFLLLAAYVTFESAKTLWLKEEPRESKVGIALSILSAIVMPSLGLAKRKIARQLGSKALEADAMETMICAYLSVILLVGLGLNALFGWWWADPVAGLLMVVLIVKEGWEAWEESGETEGHE
jgi:divalent metal cation (Fe/Co/Zn/Cd) transporter